MLTTESQGVGFLVEWLFGPRNVAYKPWLRELHRRFDLHPRERRAHLSISGDQDAEARQRIDALLSDLKELARLGASNWTRFRALGEQVNKSLARYHYTPFLGLDRPVIWKGPPARRVGRSRGGVFFWTLAPFQSDTPPQELYAVRILEIIIRNRWLDLIRRCEQCSRWFVARKPWAKHCGTAICREQAKRAYQTSEAYRAKRRKTPSSREKMS